MWLFLACPFAFWLCIRPIYFVASWLFYISIKKKKLKYRLKLQAHCFIPYIDCMEVLCASEIIFIAWESTWGKVLTLNQLHKRGFAFANRCYLCQECDEIMDNLLLHEAKTKLLWELLLSLF